jgi:putative peptide maturation dehydrogenase
MRCRSWPRRMKRVRRTEYLFFFCHDGRFLDIEQMLHGVVRLAPLKQLYAVSILGGDEVPLTGEELDLVLSVPADHWVDIDGMNTSVLERLVRSGLLLSDGDEEELVELRRRDELLSAGEWNLYGALYHFLTKWRDVDVTGFGDGGAADELPPLTRMMVEEFVGRHGRPPEPFHAVDDPLDVLALPLVRRDGELYEVLDKRKTTRAFDRETPMELEQLAIVLYHVFGCHGYAPIIEDMFTLKRTSPSAGALHPIEAYPLVANVEGLEPGIYHYRSRDHALELVARLEAAEANAVASEFMCRQTYFGAASVSFVLTARFYRSFWKYRRHPKGYAALLMDAAHLSQTLYLVCADLGLGAFVTTAVNAHNIEERLGLDGWSEGVLAMAGCGPRAEQRSPFEPEFAPYVPRETSL